MTGFIAALEEQLVTAHRDRRPRRLAVPARRSPGSPAPPPTCWPPTASARASSPTTPPTSRARTTIYYEPGYRERAQTAAACIDVGLDRVLPMTANARVLADRADIAVFIGADKAK